MGSFLSSVISFIAENKAGIASAASLAWGAVNHFGHKKTKKALNDAKATQAGHSTGIKTVAQKVMTEAEVQAAFNEMDKVTHETLDILTKSKKK